MQYPTFIATRGSALALAQANCVKDLLRCAFPKRQFELRIIKTTGDKMQTLSLATKKPVKKSGSARLLGTPSADSQAARSRQNSKGGYAPASIDKGLFTKEIEMALLRREAALAVHSLKDLPVTLPGGLILGAMPKRADVRDALIYRADVRAMSLQKIGQGSTSVVFGYEAVAPPPTKKLRKGESILERLSSESETPIAEGRKFPLGLTLNDLPQGAIVATSSLRRRAQLLALRPDVKVEEIRGNVETRLQKLEATGHWDAIILAEAGLERLNLEFQNRPAPTANSKWNRLCAELIAPSLMLPAVGQAAIGIECRADDTDTRELLAALNHFATFAAASAERSLLRALGGGCQTPIAALSEFDAHTKRLKLKAAVFSLDGKQSVRGELSEDAANYEALGEALAKDLIAKGAGELLK